MPKGLPAALAKVAAKQVGHLARLLTDGKVGRNLTQGEIALARTVFNNSIPYNKVRIHNGLFYHIPWDQKFSPGTDAWDLLCWALVPGYRWLWSNVNDSISYSQIRNAITPYGEPFFTEDAYQPDFSKSTPTNQAWFIHELVHSWQYFSGVDVVGRRVTSAIFYAPIKTSASDTPDNDSLYDFSMETKEWTQWPSLASWGLEQQAAIVAAYFWYKNKFGIRAEHDVSPGYAPSVDYFAKISQIVEAAFD